MMERTTDITTDISAEEVIPHECFCPITQEIMEDPVTAQDGYVYERTAIQQWFDLGHRLSPKTGLPLANTELITNYTMRSLIQDLKAKHKLNEENILAAVRLREQEMQAMLELKDQLLDQEKERNLASEKKLKEQEETIQELIRQMESQLAQATPVTQEKEKEKEKEHAIPQNYMPPAKSPTPRPSPKKPSNTALMEAAQSNDLITVKYLVEKRGDWIDDKNHYGKTALMLAARRGHGEVVKYLLEQGASPTTKDLNGYTAFLLAAYYGRMEVASLLLDYGTPKSQKIYQLFKHRASLSDKNNYGETAFLIAAREGKYKMLEWLLHHGASPSDRNIDGETALLMAARNGKREMMEWLLDHGASLKEKDTDGTNVLMKAVCHDHLQIVQWLLSRAKVNKDIDIYAKNSNNNSVLCFVKSPEMRRVLDDFRYYVQTQPKKWF